MRHDRLALEAEPRHRQRTREIPELVIDEDAADVILLQQRLDGAVRQLAFLAGNVDQVRSAVGRDHEIGFRRVLSQHAVTGLGMGIVGHGCILVVGIVQRQVQRFGKVDRDEAHREEVLRRVLVGRLRRRTGLALL